MGKAYDRGLKKIHNIEFRDRIQVKAQIFVSNQMRLFPKILSRLSK